MSTAFSTQEQEDIRTLFPILNQRVHGYPLIYFDNAATSQKPRQVIDALTQYYTQDNANVHRGLHTLAERATTLFEETREVVKNCLQAAHVEEIIFTKGSTESINLVAAAWGRKHLKKGDQVLISALEHHSNIVPWQLLCEDTGAMLKVIPIDPQGRLRQDIYQALLSEKTRLVALVHVSNALGTINPVQEMISAAHHIGALVLIDGAQAVPHMPVDVQALDADFYVFSGHKAYGPMGTGILYGKKEVLETMAPYQGGGEMIKDVRFSGTTYNDLPYRFEAGTPDVAAVAALKAALQFLEETGYDTIATLESSLLHAATDALAPLPGLRIIGPLREKASILSFIVDGLHAFDIGQLLDAHGIAVRTGHHCTQPLMEALGIEGTIRASFAIYNTLHEIEIFAKTLEKAIAILNKNT